MISSLLKKVFMFTREVNENISYTAFRIVVSFLFIQHGLAKYIEFPLSMTNGNGSVEIASLYGIAGIIEILFGSLTLIGFLTRISAFICSGLMACAYFIGHVQTIENFKTIPTPMLNGGESAILFCFSFLLIFCFGGRRLSLDRLIMIKKAEKKKIKILNK